MDENGSKTQMSDSLRLRKNRRERLQRRNEVLGDEGYVHYLDCGDGFMDVDLSTLNKLFILNMCHLLYVSYISIKLISKMLCSRSRLLTILNSTC